MAAAPNAKVGCGGDTAGWPNIGTTDVFVWSVSSAILSSMLIWSLLPFVVGGGVAPKENPVVEPPKTGCD